MKQLKTAEEVLKESGVYPEDFISYSTMGGCQEAMRTYAEQFINAAADIIEFETEYNAETFKADIVGSAKKILQLKEHLK